MSVPCHNLGCAPGRIAKQGKDEQNQLRERRKEDGERRKEKDDINIIHRVRRRKLITCSDLPRLSAQSKRSYDKNTITREPNTHQPFSIIHCPLSIIVIIHHIIRALNVDNRLLRAEYIHFFELVGVSASESRHSLY